MPRLSAFLVPALVSFAPMAGAQTADISQGDVAVVERQEEAASAVTAVLVRADWCAGCKVLEPRLAALMDQLKARDADFVVLDYTDRNLANLHAAADAAGVGSFTRETFRSRARTARLYFVNTATQDSYGYIGYRDDDGEILADLDDAIAKANTAG